MALRQFALQLGAQVGALFLVNEQVRITGNAELIATEHRHAGKQFADEFVEDRRHEDEAVRAAGDFPWHLGDSRQDARRLDDGGIGTATEGIPAFKLDGEIETLVEHARERVRGIETDRRQHRHHLPEEVFPDPLALGIGPLGTTQKTDVLRREQWQDHVIECPVLLADEHMRFFTYPTEGVMRGQAIGGDYRGMGLDLFLETCDTDFEELVQIAGNDAQETQALQQGHPVVLRLGENAAIEGQQAEFPIQVIFWRIVVFRLVQGHSGLLDGRGSIFSGTSILKRLAGV